MVISLLFLENMPKHSGIIVPRDQSRVLFTNGDFGKLRESEFEIHAPHFCAWLKRFKPLLLMDNDRNKGRLKWWQIHRSCDPKPNAKVNPGIDFAKNKIVIARMLSGRIWSWYDPHGHVIGGTTFNAISPFPNNDLSHKFRKNWGIITSAWMNSYLIREIWIKLLGNLKLRGVEGEVQIKNLLDLPFPQELVFPTRDKKIEQAIDEMENAAIALKTGITEDKLIKIDVAAWKILQLHSKKKLGKALTRKDASEIPLRAIS